MALIDSGSKSSRLLASRRYTHDTLTTAQESFTNVLDLRTDEIYTQAAKIPSSGLPHSGSSQSGSYYTANSENILKYYYRHKLTKSNINNETWFVLSPTGSDSGVGAQLINDNQEVNFVSPKYSLSSLATSTTEDSTPGYLAVLYKSSAISQSAQTGSLSSGDIVSTNDYVFDYKTGIIQFVNSSSAPPNTHYLYMTVNQYVGTTLSTGLELDGSVSGSATGTGSFGRVNTTDGILSPGTVESYGNFLLRESAGGDKLVDVLGSSDDGLIRIYQNNSVKARIHGNGTTYFDGGNVGIGTGATVGEALTVHGNISGSGYIRINHVSASGDVVADGDVIAYNSSDVRLKDNIEVIKGSLDKIGNIRGVEFDWNEESPGWARERGHDVGVIAQEVQKVVPEIVVERKNGFLGVDYKRLVPLLIESIKELKQEVEDLKKKVN